MTATRSISTFSWGQSRATWPSSIQNVSHVNENGSVLATVATTTFRNTTIHRNAGVLQTLKILGACLRPPFPEDITFGLIVPEETNFEFAVYLTLQIDECLVYEEFFDLSWYWVSNIGGDWIKRDYPGNEEDVEIVEPKGTLQLVIGGSRNGLAIDAEALV